MSDRLGTQLLDRAVALLDVVADGGSDGLSLKEIAERSGLNTATAHRILTSLVGHRLLSRPAGGRRYRLGTKLMVFGAKAAVGPGLRSQCQPALQRLRRRTGEMVAVMARHNHDSVCIDRRDGDTVVQTLTGAIGGSVPLGVASGSMAMLAFMPEDEREFILKANGQRYGAYSGLTVERVRETIAEVRETGYALDPGEFLVGIAGIAVPIVAMETGPVASLGLTFLTAKLTPELVAAYAALLREEVELIEPLLNPLDTRLRSPDRIMADGSR